MSSTWNIENRLQSDKRKVWKRGAAIYPRKSNRAHFGLSPDVNICWSSFTSFLGGYWAKMMQILYSKILPKWLTKEWGMGFLRKKVFFMFFCFILFGRSNSDVSRIPVKDKKTMEKCCTLRRQLWMSSLSLQFRWEYEYEYQISVIRYQ